MNVKDAFATTPDNKSPLRDHRQEITDEIIRLIEQGNDLPWHKEWESGGLPMNPTTGKPYRGGNIVSLMLAGLRRGYSDPRWMTFKQARDAGWMVRKGETSAARVEYFERKLSRNQPGDDDDPRYYALRKTYAVFNAEQIGGIPKLELKPRQPFEIINAGEDILSGSGATIRHGGNRAFYSKHDDIIQLPHKEQFTSPATYYGVAIHELAHWSGAPVRLNRESLNSHSCFGSTAYAFEELIADLTSALVRAETGLPYDKTQTAAYMKSWLKVLKDNKNAIFKAASEASLAADYLLEKTKRREPMQERDLVVASEQMAYRYR